MKTSQSWALHQVVQSLKFQSSSCSGSKARPHVVPLWSGHSPQKQTLHRHGPQTEMFSLETIRAIAGVEVMLRQTWSHMVLTGSQKQKLYKYGPLVQLLSLENLKAVAGLEEKLGQTESQHGPQKQTFPRNGPQTELFSLENLRVPAALEVELGQTRPNMILTQSTNKQKPHGHDSQTQLFSLENLRALSGLEVKLSQTWPLHGPDMVPSKKHSIDMDLWQSSSVLKISELQLVLKETQPKDFTNRVLAWYPNIDTPQTQSLDKVVQSLKLLMLKYKSQPQDVLVFPFLSLVLGF